MDFNSGNSQDRYQTLDNKGAFLSSGVDVYRISLDDELFSKWLARALLTKIFQNMPNWINSGGSKLFYDTVYTLATFMMAYQTENYVSECSKVYDVISAETDSNTINDSTYVNYGNKLLNIVISQMRFLGWFVTTRETSASLTNENNNPVKLIDEYYREIKKVNREEKIWKQSLII